MTDPQEGQQQGSGQQNQQNQQGQQDDQNQHATGASQSGQDQGQQQGSGQQNQQQGSGQQSSRDGQGQLYSQDYVGTLRSEAAGYRTQRNEYRDALRNAGMLDDDGNVRQAQSSQGQQGQQQGSGQQNQQNQQQSGPDPRDQRIQALEERIRTDGLSRTAERLATQLGGKPDRAAQIARLANLDDVRYDDRDRPDEVQVQEAITRVLNDVPELRAQTNVGGGGSNPAGGSNGGEQKNPWKPETFNLTEQGRITKENPALATRLMAEAQ